MTLDDRISADTASSLLVSTETRARQSVFKKVQGIERTNFNISKHRSNYVLHKMAIRSVFLVNLGIARIDECHHQC